MFEAHSIYSQDLFSANSVSLPCKRFNRTHVETLKPLSIWFVEGKRKLPTGEINKAIFVYSEYRDNKGDQRFACQQYLYPDHLQEVDIERYILLATEQPIMV
ncbi:hypothetical protein [Neptuniibacter sp.]|uniref:hypothetical protein n=1 Tax=Neptuniibacter sp. TaxID=1962643 RepID=UPI002613BDCF|nr:hypothetical protein [Neptuniibacter sp.]MCP4598842.1 hypothetical protein [Neptuniibacter sp.]